MGLTFEDPEGDTQHFPLNRKLYWNTYSREAPLKCLVSIGKTQMWSRTIS